MLSYSLGFTQFLHYVASSMQRIMDLHTKHIKPILNYGQAYCEERSNYVRQLLFILFQNTK